MMKIKSLTAFSVFSLFLTSASPAIAISKTEFNGISTSTLPGSNDTSSPFTNDVLLDQVTYNDATFDANGSDGNSFRAVNRLEVTGDREQTNAEFGDIDGTNEDNDGDDNPFNKAGVNSGSLSQSKRESTDPNIQDPALLNAFNSRSLSEIGDGEAGGFGYRLVFDQALSDNNTSSDNVPEIILFERGLNDQNTEVEVITGGTFDNPTLSNTVSVSGGDFAKTGISINTVEIRDSQKLGIVGIDLNHCS